MGIFNKSKKEEKKEKIYYVKGFLPNIKIYEAYLVDEDSYKYSIKNPLTGNIDIVEKSTASKNFSDALILLNYTIQQELNRQIVDIENTLEEKEKPHLCINDTPTFITANNIPTKEDVENMIEDKVKELSKKNNKNRTKKK